MKSRPANGNSKGYLLLQVVPRGTFFSKALGLAVFARSRACNRRRVALVLVCPTMSLTHAVDVCSPEMAPLGEREKADVTH